MKPRDDHRYRSASADKSATFTDASACRDERCHAGAAANTALEIAIIEAAESLNHSLRRTLRKLEDSARIGERNRKEINELKKALHSQTA